MPATKRRPSEPRDRAELLCRSLASAAGLLLAASAAADNLNGAGQFLCATGQVVICAEGAECQPVLALNVKIPQFVVVNVEKKMLSTTQASGLHRVTPIGTMKRTDGRIYLQGIDRGRAYSFVIDETTGRATVAVSRDGMTVTAFAACTNAKVDAEAGRSSWSP